jgi:demethylmenaquinone methyltransferase/2-methoxy-6-polyprenyl-1,4-benzoquinol methylase
MPESHFLRALGRFQAAGLQDTTARTFVGDIQAPLSGDVRRALEVLFEMLWGERQPQASAEDWAEYQRLCRPKSPDFILSLPDYYAFFTYTMFRGRVPG